jgi:hypothetical protein
MQKRAISRGCDSAAAPETHALEVRSSLKVSIPRSLFTDAVRDSVCNPRQCSIAAARCNCGSGDGKLLPSVSATISCHVRQEVSRQLTKFIPPQALDSIPPRGQSSRKLGAADQAQSCTEADAHMRPRSATPRYSEAPKSPLAVDHV